MKFSEQLWFPGGVLLLCAAGVQLSVPALSAAEPFLTGFALLALAAGAVLGGMYNRSRPVASLAVIGAAAWLLPALYTADGAPHWQPQTLALLLPLNLIVFALLPDRGLFARTSLLAATALAVQAVVLLVLPRGANPWMEGQLAYAPMPSGWFQWSWVGEPALVAFGAAAILLAGIFLWRRRPTDRGLFWLLVAAFAGVHGLHDPRLAMLYFGSGALIVSVSLVEHAHAMAYVDALTGLASRRALDEFLPQLHGRFALAMVDVDHFKRFNDAYGHAAGDQVLRKVAGQLETVGGGGRVFRYGGEEFSVVFAGRSRKDALPHLEALRARIEATGFSLRGSLRPTQKPAERRALPRAGRHVHLTVSIGVAELSEKLASPRLVIEAADKALYRAKQSGRNRVQAA
ncbi:MAG: GGDEF domain-containing protein [Vicinamibacterales bacterium]